MASGYIRGTSSRGGKKEKSGSGFTRGRQDLDRYDRTYNGAEVQNVKAARVYVFGDNFREEDENVEFEMPEMRSRHKGSSSQSHKPEDDHPTFFEKEIAEGETLQAIALKYACPVAELKRINNLIQDQEFYALRVVKVPINKYGILSQTLQTEDTRSSHSKHINGAAYSPDSDQEHYSNYFSENDSQHDFSDPETQMKVMRTLSIRENFSSQGKEAEKFLQKMDIDLKKLKQSNNRTDRESLSEVISVLTNKSIHPLQTNESSRKQNGADCGISWWSILVMSLLIGIVVPLVFIIYYFFLKT